MRVKVIQPFAYAANGFTIETIEPSDELQEIADACIPALIAEGKIEDPSPAREPEPVVDLEPAKEPEPPAPEPSAEKKATKKAAAAPETPAAEEPAA